jgi:hypothetical protein
MEGQAFLLTFSPAGQARLEKVGRPAGRNQASKQLENGYAI